MSYGPEKLLESLAASLSGGVSALTSFSLFALSIPSALGVRLPGYALVKLPLGLRALLPLRLLPGVWLNMLHVYCYRDYEILGTFTPRRGQVVVDLGAFVGFYTLRAARLAGPEGCVVSVEPLPQHYCVLELNARLNKLENVELVRACIAGSRGVRRLYVPCYSANASLIEEYAERAGRVERAVHTRCITLQDLLEETGLKEIDLLKMDLEGAELEVLESSEDLLDPAIIRRIVVEVHREVVKPYEVSSLLEEAGYDVLVYEAPGALEQAFVYAMALKEL